MEPPADLQQLVGLSEIAIQSAVGRAAVVNWRRRYRDFPKPIAELHCGPIFWWPQVEAWLRANERF